MLKNIVGANFDPNTDLVSFILDENTHLTKLLLQMVFFRNSVQSQWDIIIRSSAGKDNPNYLFATNVSLRHGNLNRLQYVIDFRPNPGATSVSFRHVYTVYITYRYLIDQGIYCAIDGPLYALRGQYTMIDQEEFYRRQDLLAENRQDLCCSII
jgi:hypothetical protein